MTLIEKNSVSHKLSKHEDKKYKRIILGKKGKGRNGRKNKKHSLTVQISKNLKILKLHE